MVAPLLAPRPLEYGVQSWMRLGCSLVALGGGAFLCPLRVDRKGSFFSSCAVLSYRLIFAVVWCVCILAMTDFGDVLAALAIPSIDTCVFEIPQACVVSKHCKSQKNSW